ncbi:hypothetical protein BUE76_22090 [Cnuella takakiae]|nr:hypothetical protein BUE76_22090 [Cnuella takakiae]
MGLWQFKIRNFSLEVRQLPILTLPPWVWMWLSHRGHTFADRLIEIAIIFKFSWKTGFASSVVLQVFIRSVMAP